MHKSIYYFFVCEVVLVSILYLTIYLVGQQILRQLANNPQIQMAEDISYGLSNGKNYSTVLNTSNIDPNLSLSPFTLIYDINGNILSDNLSPSANLPSLPKGIFAYVQGKGEDRFTWQPSNNLRLAVVVTEYIGKNGGGFVLVGRSLREVENLESTIEIYVSAAWFISILLLFTFTKLYINNKKI